jgi:hypothetical protein
MDSEPRDVWIDRGVIISYNLMKTSTKLQSRQQPPPPDGCIDGSCQ